MVAPTTRITQLVPFVAPHIHAAPRPLVELSIRQAAIEFCERTHAWRHIISTAVVTQKAIPAAPDYCAIHKIESATLDGKPLIPITHTDVLVDDLSGAQDVGVPQYITQSTPNEVQIYPFAPGTLRLSVTLKPRSGQLFGTDPDDPLHDAYNVVPEFFVSQHAETLAAGALARLFVIPMMPWTDEKRALLYRRDFERRCTDHRAAAFKGQQNARLRTKPVWM